MKSFVSSKNKYYLGLDLGISSVGWAVMVKDQTEDHYLHDFGVRIFDVAEDGKTGVSDAQTRRGFRSQRRLIRRRVYRIQKIKSILEEKNFLTEEEFKKQFNLNATNKIIKKNGKFTTEKGYWNPFVARNKGLEEKLTKAEIYAVLIHFCKKRGYLDKFSMENEGKEDETKKKTKSKFGSAIDDAEELIEKHGYVSKVVLNEPKFQIEKSDQILIYAKNGKHDKNPENSSNYRYLFSRKAYENELKAILDKQGDYYEEIKRIKNKLIKTIFQQRDFEVGAKCKEHKTKCNPNACSKYKTFAEMLSRCSFYPEETRGYKSSLLWTAYYFVVEISKFLSFLKNQEGIRFEKPVLLKLLKNFMTENWKKSEIKTYLKETKIWKEKGSDSLFRVDWWKDNKNGMDLNKAIFLKEITRISKLKKLITNINFNTNFVSQLEENVLNKLGKILSNNITPQRRREKVEKFLKSNDLSLNEEELENLKNASKGATSPSKVSFKYMTEIIKLFLEGQNISKSIAKRRIEDNISKKWQKTKRKEGEKIFSRLIDWDVQKNPIVFRAVNQARKVLKALYQLYGNFEYINLEVARDVAKSWKDRNKIKNKQLKSAENNEKIGEELEKLNFKITSTNILAYKLWIEQDEKCIYCGKKIIIDNISPSKKIVEIDHIIPISKFADDSYLNKVLVCLNCNQNKENRTPLQFLPESAKRGFKLRAERIGWKAKKEKRSQKKHFYLMTQNIEGNEDFDNFISRNLNDTRYITSWLLGYIKKQISLFDKKTKTLAIAGQITSQLRRNWLENSPWGLQNKVRDITPFHHAIDAIIICQFKGQYEVELTSDLCRLNKQKEKWQKTKKIYWKEQAKLDYNNFSKWIKNKWQKREKNDFVKLIGKLDDEDMLAKPRYIQNLQTQIEKRIPVVLNSIDCEDCKGKTSWDCKNCLGDRKVPKFKNILNQEDWEKEKNNILNADKINLKFQLISYMTNYKIKGSWASSENFGFKDKEKTRYFKIWKKDPRLENPNNQKLVKIEKWREWVKDFDKNEGFIFDEKTGNIIPTDKYYGLLLENNENKWIRQIDIKQNLKNEKNWELPKDKTLVKGVNIEYWDQKKRKFLIKNFRGKNGEKSYVHPNQLQFISGFEKMKKTFNNWINNVDMTNNFQKKYFKIIKIDILGNIIKQKKSSS